MMYAVFSYDSINLGDEIQSIAAARLIKKLGGSAEYLLGRESHAVQKITTDVSFETSLIPLDDDQVKSVRVLLNGWMDGNYMAWPENLPVEVQQDALLISIHINELPKDQTYDWLENANSLKEQKKSLLDHTYTFLRDKTIGCRDPFTYAKIMRRGLKAYMSGCLTMTLESDTDAARTKIYLVDVSMDSIRKYLPPADMEFLSNARLITHVYDGKSTDVVQKFMLAEKLLEKYKKARLVITSRLHCALPCLAYGTPVVYYHQSARSDDVRYQSLIDTIPVIGRDRINFQEHKNVKPAEWQPRVDTMSRIVSEWMHARTRV